MPYVFYNSSGLAEGRQRGQEYRRRAWSDTAAQCARLEADSANAAAFARALPMGWQYSLEQNVTSLQEPVRRPQFQRGRK
jgi:hypothetical protein